MEQRSLRLGDIVDDYCPRERRITNHAIVAIVEDAIRQTRCTTCDHEHVFKGGHEPRRRKKSTENLFEQVLADIAGPSQLVPPRAVEPPAPVESPSVVVMADAADTIEDSLAEEPPVAEGGSLMHRRLIRATLPKTEGELPPPRPIPEFTMYQRPPARSARFRFGGGGGQPGQNRSNGQANGNVAGPSRDQRPNRGFQGNGQGPNHRDGAGNGANPGSGRRRNHKRAR